MPVDERDAGEYWYVGYRMLGIVVCCALECLVLMQSAVFRCSNSNLCAGNRNRTFRGDGLGLIAG
jgi:hypothetical protein